MRTGKSKSPQSENRGSQIFTIQLEKGVEAVEVVHEFSSLQHTLRWSSPIRGASSAGTSEATALAPGSCCLYRYPKLVPREGLVLPVSDAEVQLLHKVLLAIALGPTASDDAGENRFLDVFDGSGATVVLALLIANTAAAIELFMAIVRHTPRALLAEHGPGPFLGENTIHVMMVNRRETELLELVPFAIRNFTRGQLRKLLCTQARGGFFNDAPMVYYGGTPLAYAVAFSLRSVVAALLESVIDEPEKMHGLLDINDPSRFSCAATGFLPLHVAVANDLTAMYDFLLSFKGLPQQKRIKLYPLRAHPEAPCARGKVRAELCHLTALQLAVKMGKKRLFQHALRRQCDVLWQWGPVTCYALDLAPIDSVSEGGSQVMELLGRHDAAHATKEFLLDEFMAGILHQLFAQKWGLYARHWYWMMRLLDTLYFACMVALALGLKMAPRSLENYRELPMAMIAITIPIFFLDLRLATLWLANFISGGGQRSASASDTDRVLPSPAQTDSSGATAAADASPQAGVRLNKMAAASMAAKRLRATSAPEPVAAEPTSSSLWGVGGTATTAAKFRRQATASKWPTPPPSPPEGNGAWADGDADKVRSYDAEQTSTEEVTSLRASEGENGANGEAAPASATPQLTRSNTMAPAALTEGLGDFAEGLGESLSKIGSTMSGVGGAIDDFQEDVRATTFHLITAFGALVKWLNQENIFTKLFGQCMVMAVCFLLLNSNTDHLSSDAAPGHGSSGHGSSGDKRSLGEVEDAFDGQLAGRMLTSRGGGGGGGDTSDGGLRYANLTALERYGTDQFFVAFEHLCVPLAIGIFCFSVAFVEALFIPFRKSGVLWRSVRSMVFDDVATWFGLFSICFVSFGLAMFVSFPVSLDDAASGDFTIGVVPKFNHWISATFGMIQLGLIGAEFEIHPVVLDGEDGSYAIHPFFGVASTAELISLSFFMFMYLCYIVMAVIVLLNLLIAMMCASRPPPPLRAHAHAHTHGKRSRLLARRSAGVCPLPCRSSLTLAAPSRRSTTYQSYTDRSVLEWRVDFARAVLKTELACYFLSKPRSLCRPWRPWELRAGIRDGEGKFVYYFRHVEANQEGGGKEGGTSVFEDYEDDDPAPLSGAS